MTSDQQSLFFRQLLEVDPLFVVIEFVLAGYLLATSEANLVVRLQSLIDFTLNVMYFNLLVEIENERLKTMRNLKYIGK